MKPLVDFLIIGAQKSGTTTLFDLLRQHPEIAAPRIKEPGYFLARPYFKDPVDTIEKYHSLFDKKEGQLAFEATVDYSSYPHLIDDCWNNIHQYNPKMKIIYILRDPLKRIISAHRFFYKRGVIETQNINEFLKASDYHIDFSKYYTQIQPYLETFGKEQIKILFLDDLYKNQENTLHETYRFLGISLNDQAESSKKLNTKEQLNLRKGAFANMVRKMLFLKKILPASLIDSIKKSLKPILERKIDESDLKLNRESVEKLQQVLLPDIERLESLTGRDLSEWKNSLHHYPIHSR